MAANVNKPTNTALKDADVNRKLQLYGIASAFQNGKVPSNDQIDVALTSFMNSRALSSPSGKLSDDGKVLVQDAREVVKQAKYLLLSKNEGNLIQDFIWQTTHFDAKSIDTPNVPVSKDAAKKDGDDALQGLRTLGQLLITNGQFRKLLKDSTILLRDMAGDAATNAASKVRPSEDQLSQIDAPAEDNTWHEKPNLSKEQLKQQVKGAYGGNPKKDIQDTAAAAGNSGIPSNNEPRSLDPVAAQTAARNVAQDRLESKVDTEEVKKNALQLNEEARQRAREYLRKKMPQDRREQTVWRLKKMILECQQHEDYSQAVQTILRLAETYSRHGRTLGSGSAGTAKNARTGLQAAERDLRTIIERFANGTSTENLWEAINEIYKHADQDAELKNWFKSLDKYIRRCLLEQGYVLDDASTEEWHILHDQGKYLLRDKYRSDTDRVLDEIKFIADQFDKDPQNKAFGQAVDKLFKDLGNDHDGKPVFKPHLVKDLRDVIIPAVLENIAYIPVPRIEYSDPQVDAVIENLVLESDNFAPNVLEFSSENYFRWGRKKIASKKHQTIEVKVAGIQMDLRDVSFHVKRKSGFPALSDTGVADIILPGDGFSFKMKVSTADKNDKQNIFKVEKVDVDVKKLDIKLKKSNHKLLFGLFKPLALKVIRPPLQKAVEKAIKEQCNNLDQQLYKVKQEAIRAKEAAKSDPENVPNMYQRYYDAAQKELFQKKKKAEQAVADKKFNMAMTKEDSIFPNIHLPGGISSKATEFKELARKGDRWESPVFSMGSAKKSTDIPTAPKIERKSHPVGTNGHTGSHSNGHANGQTNGSNTLNGGGVYPPNGGLNSQGYKVETAPPLAPGTANINTL